MRHGARGGSGRRGRAIAVLDHRIVVVTGKGGVGKSTVAAALGAAAAARGRRVCVAEVARRADVEHVVLAAGADHLSIDPQEALEEYLADQLPVRALAELLVSSRAFSYLAAATPGLRELLTAGKVWELAQDRRRTPGAAAYDLVVVDAPATGHGVGILTAPRTFADAARVGPVARHARIIHGTLSDPAQTAVVAVATAEEMPVNETVALERALRNEVGLAPALVLVNGVRPDRFSGAEAETLRAAADGGGHPALTAVLDQHERARVQRRQLARLRRAIAAPAATLPFCPDGGGSADVGALARRLEALV